MTESEIGGLIIAILMIGIMVAWFVYIIILAYKSNHEGKKSKKERIIELENKVKVLEFRLENPTGLELVEDVLYGCWKLRYIQADSFTGLSFGGQFVTQIILPSATEYKFVRGFIVDDKGNKYKFDIKNEILIKIEKK